jgi:putative SOS response-associated peptidase YedK
MCSRFEVNIDAQDISDLTDLVSFDDLPASFASSEVRPTDAALVINSERPQMMPWGLSVAWDNKPLINARAETLSQKPTFQPLLKNRCLVPASAYFEWRRHGVARLKNRIARADGQPIYFAGLHDGARFVIITCTPVSDIAHIHNRMPVILASGNATHWISQTTNFDQLAGLLSPPQPDALRAEEDIPPEPRQPDLFSTGR